MFNRLVQWNLRQTNLKENQKKKNQVSNCLNKTIRWMLRMVRHVDPKKIKTQYRKPQPQSLPRWMAVGSGWPSFFQGRPFKAIHSFAVKSKAVARWLSTRKCNIGRNFLYLRHARQLSSILCFLELIFLSFLLVTSYTCWNIQLTQLASELGSRRAH